MRLFVAIELGDAVKAVLIQGQAALSEFNRMVRWVGDQQMHLTLKFLGEVAETELPPIRRVLDDAARKTPSFDLCTDGTGCFPAQGPARVIWIALADASGRLATCQMHVERGLAAIGYAAEQRPFAPHVTLGRVKVDSSGGRLRRQVEALDRIVVRQEVDSVVLVESQLSPHGARYTRIGTWRVAPRTHEDGSAVRTSHW